MKCQKDGSKAKEKVGKKRHYLISVWFCTTIIESSFEELEKCFCALCGMKQIGKYFNLKRVGVKIKVIFDSSFA